MINPCNPLAQGDVDDYPDGLASYGDDSDYSPFDDSDNNEQVFPPNVGNRNQDLITHLERNVNALQDSNSFGIDIYINALELVAVFFEPKCYAKNTMSIHIRIMTDNTTAV